MEDFERILNPGTVPHRQEGRAPVPVFVKVKYRDGRLSITGVEGPLRNGNAVGSCGQIVDTLARKDFTPTPGDGAFWAMKSRKLRQVWERWHLNDMRPECTHQRALGWVEKAAVKVAVKPPAPFNYKTEEKGLGWLYEKEHPEGLLCRPCPECGYKYGSEWRREEVPESVLRFLYECPEAATTPAWV
jgi:hypothetical protein